MTKAVALLLRSQRKPPEMCRKEPPYLSSSAVVMIASPLIIKSKRIMKNNLAFEVLNSKLVSVH